MVNGDCAMSSKFRPGSIIQYKYTYTNIQGSAAAAFGILLRRIEYDVQLPQALSTRSNKWLVYWFDLKSAGTIFDAELELVLP